MRTPRLFLIAPTLALFLAAAPAVFAQATRTWVSGVGDDVNPCSRTAPCKTFAGAISKTAAGGEIDAIDPGGFGALTITKSIVVDGTGTMASILFAGTNGVNINVPGGHVTLRNLSLNGAGTGITGVRIIAATSVTIEGCEISSFTTAGVQDARATPGRLQILDTTIRNGGVGANGVVVEVAATNVQNTLRMDNSRISFMGAIGLFVANNARAMVTRSSFYGNGDAGIRVNQGVAAGTAEVNCDYCTSSSNLVGIQTNGAGAKVRLNNSFITDNRSNGLVIGAGTTIDTFQHNRIAGNIGNNGAGMSIVSEQ